MKLIYRLQDAQHEVKINLSREKNRLRSIFRILGDDVRNIFEYSCSYDRAEERFQFAFNHLRQCRGLFFTKGHLAKLLGKKAKKMGKAPINKRKLKNYANSLMKLVKAWSVFGGYMGKKENMGLGPYDDEEIQNLLKKMTLDRKQVVSLEQTRMIQTLNCSPRDTFEEFVEVVRTDDDILDKYGRFYNAVIINYDSFIELKNDPEIHEFPNNLKLFDRHTLLQYLEECYIDYQALRDKE